MKETDLAARVVTWLREQRFTVYQEVQMERCGAIADIVVDVNGHAWVIETKTALGLTVIRQAAYWQRYVSRVSVAVPAMRTQSRDREFARLLCRERGIGTVEVRGNGSGFLSEPVERTEPRFHRPPRRSSVSNLLNYCTEAHQTYCCAGTARGGYLTPYRETMDRIGVYLRKHGPATARQIIEDVRHHWVNTSTARSCLIRNLQLVEEPKGWVRCVRNGRSLMFEATRTDTDT